MIEENKFKKIDNKDLYNDSIGSVSLYDASYSNTSEEQRIWLVTTLASIAYGNETSKNPEELYKRLQSLKHESLWEFIRDVGYVHEIDDEYFAPGCTISGSMRNVRKDVQYELSETDIVNEYKNNIACFRIKIPIFIARQFFRHRSASFIETSRRYTNNTKKPFEWFCNYGSEEANIIVDNFHKESYNTYLKLLDLGIHTQKASRILGQDVYTEFYCMFEKDGLKNFFNLRCEAHAQAEIRELAESMAMMIRDNQPELFSYCIS